MLSAAGADGECEGPLLSPRSLSPVPQPAQPAVGAPAVPAVSGVALRGAPPQVSPPRPRPRPASAGAGGRPEHSAECARQRRTPPPARLPQWAHCLRLEGDPPPPEQEDQLRPAPTSFLRPPEQPSPPCCPPQLLRSMQELTAHAERLHTCRRVACPRLGRADDPARRAVAAIPRRGGGELAPRGVSDDQGRLTSSKTRGGTLPRGHSRKEPSADAAAAEAAADGAWGRVPAPPGAPPRRAPPWPARHTLLPKGWTTGRRKRWRMVDRRTPVPQGPTSFSVVPPEPSPHPTAEEVLMWLDSPPPRPGDGVLCPCCGAHTRQPPDWQARAAATPRPGGLVAEVWGEQRRRSATARRSPAPRCPPGVRPQRPQGPATHCPTPLPPWVAV
eukprot:TRINITY_DN2979_c0_g3_i1.p1 TRINITY_DN2979_c0_g3~~TRINITY_DN2979_c0_g3_i1.p1  ORF type:complete len:387 (+),score=36.18 TRINITY_DN2979_c0_g3_i1:118-1278(+)